MNKPTRPSDSMGRSLPKSRLDEWIGFLKEIVTQLSKQMGINPKSVERKKERQGRQK